MTVKTLSLGVVITLLWVASAFGQVGNDYKLRSSGFNKINPTRVGSVLGQVLLMQEAQAKLRKGVAPGQHRPVRGLGAARGAEGPGRPREPETGLRGERRWASRLF